MIQRPPTCFEQQLDALQLNHNHIVRLRELKLQSLEILKRLDRLTQEAADIVGDSGNGFARQYLIGDDSFSIERLVAEVCLSRPK